MRPKPWLPPVIAVTSAVARNVVIPKLPAFLQAHPRLVLEFSSTDRRVDVVREGFDCVLRVGTLVDSGLGTMRMINCASPGYLRTFDTPNTLGD